MSGWTQDALNKLSKAPLRPSNQLGGTDVPDKTAKVTRAKESKPKPQGRDTPPEVFKPEPSIIRAKEGFYGQPAYRLVLKDEAQAQQLEAFFKSLVTQS